MFCPKCSQPQASEEMRYCSGCGFPLLGVAELVASDGTALVKGLDGRETSRRKMITRGWAGLTILNLILAPFVVVGVQSVELVVIYLFFSLVWMLGGFAWLIYSHPVREAGEFLDKKNRESGLPSREAHSALPPDRNVPIDLFLQPQPTNELLTPPSVTEGTTKLLNKS